MLPWHQTVNLNEIHPFVGTWGRREKEHIAGEGCVLWQTGGYLLYVSSLAPTPVNCGKVFSSSPVLFSVSTRRSSSCSDFCSWQHFSLVPQSEHFSCRTSNSSTSGELPVTQPSIPVHLLAATSTPCQPPVLRCKARRESWNRSG